MWRKWSRIWKGTKLAAVILVFQNNKQLPWCFSKPVLWEFNYFLKQTLSFVQLNCQRCWPREWKLSLLFQASPGRIEALECRAPFDPEITSPLRPKVMFTITVQDGEIVALCFSDWEVEPHRGKLSVSLLNTDKCILPSSFKYHLVIRQCVHIYIRGLDFNESLRGTNDRVPAPCFVVCYTAISCVITQAERGVSWPHRKKTV